MNRARIMYQHHSHWTAT